MLILTLKRQELLGPSRNERTRKPQYIVSVTKSAVSLETIRLFCSSVRPVGIGKRTFAGTDGEVATVTPEVAELNTAALLLAMVSNDTGRTAAAAGSVAKLAQGASTGGSGDAEQATLLAVQTTVNATAIAWLERASPCRVALWVAPSTPRLATITRYGLQRRSQSSSMMPQRLYEKLTVIGVDYLDFGARPNPQPSEISGTIASISKSGGTTTIVVEITACGSGLRPDEYTYQIQSSQTQALILTTS
ncbi:MAG: hypothetical protein IPL86_19260 [Flavobacteriales bacterium]|nr:hypothetical protein [Flavobacteriales bacterium]